LRSNHAKRQRPGLKISGKTIDGKPVIQGVFHVTSSIGLPLEVILDILTKQGLVVDWKDYYETSLSLGCNPHTIVNRIETSVGDCFGPKYREEVMKRLKELYEGKFPKDILEIAILPRNYKGL
jgi:hypothetical protein